MADGGAAYRRARDKELARRRETEIRKLAEHNARVTGTGRSVPSTARVKAGPEPPYVRTSPEISWWSQPRIHQLLRRLDATTARHQAPSGCPNCGGTRIRQQQALGSGRYIYHCPIDWGPTTLATGCDWRWSWSEPTEQRVLPE